MGLTETSNERTERGDQAAAEIRGVHVALLPLPAAASATAATERGLERAASAHMSVRKDADRAAMH